MPSLKDSTDKPLVTIGVTCFNAEDTISRAIASALAQDWLNLEVLIVDDGSSDASVATVNEAILGESRARLLRHKHNIGPAGTRNTIIREARGEFIAFADDDDESLPGRISAQVNRIVTYETQTGASLVACYVSGERRYSNGYIKPLPAIGSVGSDAPNGPSLAGYILINVRNPKWFYGAGVPACALMARKQTFAAVNGFDETLRRVEDNDFAVRLAFRGGHFIGTAEKALIQHSTAAVDKSPEKNLEAEQKLVEKNAHYLQSIGRYYYARHWPKLRYCHFKRRYDLFALELLGLVSRDPVAVLGHLFQTGPSRLLHEWRMRRRGVTSS